MPEYRAVITGELSEPHTPTDLAEQITGADGVLIPGCFFYDVTAEAGGEEDADKVRVTCSITADRCVQGGDWDGEEVTPEFIAKYIMGAGEYWASGGDMFWPEKVIVTHA